MTRIRHLQDSNRPSPAVIHNGLLTIFLLISSLQISGTYRDIGGGYTTCFRLNAQGHDMSSSQGKAEFFQAALSRLIQIYELSIPYCTYYPLNSSSQPTM